MFDYLFLCETVSTAWQECFDESTGYPYYWHTESNEVTWEIPPELRIWKERSQVGVNPQNLHLSRWPGLSSNACKQTFIKEI